MGRIIAYPIILVGVFIIFQGIVTAQSSGSTERFILIALFALPFFLIGAFITEAFERSDRDVAQKEAQQVFANLTREDRAEIIAEADQKVSASQRFFLYLRPFELDGNFKIDEHGSLLRPGPQTLERVLSDSMSGSIIGLGPEDDSLSKVGRAGLFDEWKDLIGRAIMKSEKVFIIPAANAGTLWELGEIINGSHIGKTIFIMPPSNLGKRNYTSFWQVSQSKIQQQYGILLPDYHIAGGMFRWSSAADGWRYVKFSFPLDVAKFRKIFRQLDEGGRVITRSEIKNTY